MAKCVPQEIARSFESKDIQEAIILCYDRSVQFVREYLEENFILAPEESIPRKTPTAVVDRKNAEQSTAARTNEVNTNDENIAVTPDDSQPGEQTASESASEEAEPANDETEKPDKPRVQKPPEPSLIEKFAKSAGFSKEVDDKYHHSDGSWLQRAPHGSIFQWERYSEDGIVIQCYWLKEHCLETEHIQMGVEVWDACEQDQKLNSIILLDPIGQPEQISGEKLQQMYKAGKLKIKPATYRLVYKNE